MVKKREDFETEQEYLEYVSTPEFIVIGENTPTSTKRSGVSGR